MDACPARRLAATLAAPGGPACSQLTAACQAAVAPAATLDDLRAVTGPVLLDPAPEAVAALRAFRDRVDRNWVLADTAARADDRLPADEMARVCFVRDEERRIMKLADAVLSHVPGV